MDEDGTMHQGTLMVVLNKSWTPNKRINKGWPLSGSFRALKLKQLKFYFFFVRKKRSYLSMAYIQLAACIEQSLPEKHLAFLFETVKLERSEPMNCLTFFQETMHASGSLILVREWHVMNLTFLKGTSTSAAAWVTAAANNKSIEEI